MTCTLPNRMQLQKVTIGDFLPPILAAGCTMDTVQPLHIASTLRTSPQAAAQQAIQA